MVGAHVTDAWTRVEDRGRYLYMVTVFIAGMAAPLFLFLAGLTITMAASSRAAKVGHAEAAALARKRGLQIFALAFLFRLQSQLLGWGAFINFLKVDILNVMGIAMIAAAILWSLSATRVVRISLFAFATALVAMATPLVREASILAALPDAIEAYVRPLAGRTNFALFPWAAFVLAGGMAGELVFAAQSESQERRLQAGLLVSGLAGIASPTRRRFVRRFIRLRISGRARRRSFSSASAFARQWCRSLSASITFTGFCAGASRLAPAPPTCPAGLSRHLADRRCSFTGFTSRWRTEASRCR